MDCEVDKNSILYRGDKGAFIQFYRLPSGVVRTGGFGNLDLNSALVENLHAWLSVGINPDRPFTPQSAGGPPSVPSKAKGAGILNQGSGGAK